MIVEVFKTDIRDKKHALLSIETIKSSVPNYKVNVDLDDCDKVLRIQSAEAIEVDSVISMLRKVSCNASVLEDKVI